MRQFTCVAFMVLVAVVSAVPITPAAFGHQRRAEQMRMEGMNEHQIAEHLALPVGKNQVQGTPMLSQLSARIYSIFETEAEIDSRDLSGDIAPGSLEAPQMLPRAASPPSLTDTVKDMLWGADIKKREFGYEGKELELRRPEGMRHWN